MSSTKSKFRYNCRKEECQTVCHRSKEKSDTEGHDNMRRSNRYYNLFERKFFRDLNRRSVVYYTFISKTRVYSRSLNRRALCQYNSYLLSASVKNFILSIDAGIKKYPEMPTKAVNTPSYIKKIKGNKQTNQQWTIQWIIYITNINIHAHPGLPFIPSIFSIAAASNPEKAPDKDAAEEKRDILEEIRQSA